MSKLPEEEIEDILFNSIVAVGTRDNGAVRDLDTLIIDRQKAVDSLSELFKDSIVANRLDELLTLDKIGRAVANRVGTDFEDLSAAYDKQILKRCADLTAPPKASNVGGDE